jgi:RDD family protein
VRAAITQQGVGLVTDLGRRLTAITEKLDDAFELLVHRILRRPGEEAETNQVGLVTRAVAAAIDLGLIGLALSLGSTVLAAVIPALKGDSSGVSIFGLVGFTVLGVWLGGSAFVAFWALIGRTPGMSLLSIHLEAEGSREIGLRRALKRIFAVPLALLPLGLGYWAIVTSPERRGWHDRMAGTTMVYDPPAARAAPWATLDPGATSGTPADGSGPAGH